MLWYCKNRYSQILITTIRCFHELIDAFLLYVLWHRFNHDMTNPELNPNQISLSIIWNKNILTVKEGRERHKREVYTITQTHTHTLILRSDSLTTLSGHPRVYNPHALVAVHPLVLHVHPADKLRSGTQPNVNFRLITLKTGVAERAPVPQAARFLYLQDLSEEGAGSGHARTCFEIHHGAAGFFQLQV